MRPFAVSTAATRCCYYAYSWDWNSRINCRHRFRESVATKLLSSRTLFAYPGTSANANVQIGSKK